ncbi:MAG: sodium:proton antiporter [Pseudomonadales bacterium]|nr:sodium:proton antiporter [Pseudomonadales bacterium]
MHLGPLVLLTAIVAAGVLAQWIAWRTRLPAILFLLAFGLVAGPVAGILDPDALFGDLLFPAVSLAVAVILFEGALTLRFDEIRGLGRVVRNLVTVGAAATWLVMAATAHLLVDLPWGIALLFGALVVVTGPTVIVPMLRTVRPTEKVASALRWEGIVIDPLGALLAVLVYQFLISSYAGDAGGSLLGTFLTMVAVGTGLGLAAGRGLAVALRRHWLPEYLHNVITLAAVASVFTLSDLAVHESGLLAVTVMGMTMANTRDTPLEDILDFKESLSLLLISGLFIVLAARLDLGRLQALGPAALGVLAVLVFVARPLGVFLSTLGSELKPRERALVAWIGPRGIVAAAVSAVFALRLQDAGVEEAVVIVPLTFAVIIGTVLVQGLTAGPLARALGVAEPEPRGVLIVGANPLARKIGKAISDAGFRVLLTDTQWELVREARMAGLQAFFGSPVSEHADRHLDLVGLGRLLALSPSAQLNALACLRYATEFGRGRVHAIGTSAEKAQRSAASVAGRPGSRLFGEEVDYAALAGLVGKGAEVRRTRLTDSFSFDDYRAEYGDDVIPLFALNPEGRLRLFVTRDGPAPEAGWIVFGLVLAKDAPERGEAPEASSGPDVAGPPTVPAGEGASGSGA